MPAQIVDNLLIWSTGTFYIQALAAIIYKNNMVNFTFQSIAFCFAVLLYSCNSANRTTGKDGEIIYGVEDSDVEMNSAIEKATATLNDFKVSLKSENEEFQDFAIKMKVQTEEGTEHIWINGISIEGDSLVGIVDNLPEYTSDLKLWDVVKINPQDISDWMYTKQDTLKGGYTIRVLRNRMTKEEREQFDIESGLVIN